MGTSSTALVTGKILLAAMLPEVSPANASAASCSNGSWLDVAGGGVVLEMTVLDWTPGRGISLDGRPSEGGG